MKLLRWSKSIYLALILAVANIVQCLERPRGELFTIDKESVDHTDVNFLGRPEYHDCFITVREIKRIGGQCVKIRNKVQGCVAGNTMIPFHQDCV